MTEAPTTTNAPTTTKDFFAATHDRLNRHRDAVAVFLNGETRTVTVGSIPYHMPLETYARRALFATVRRFAQGRVAYVVTRINDQIIVYTLKNEVHVKSPLATLA